EFVGKNPPRQAVLDFLLPKKAEKLSLKVLDLEGHLVRSLDVAKEKDAGMHRVNWDVVSGAAPKGPKGKQKKAPLTPPGQAVKPGTYVVVLEADGVTSARPLTVEADPRTQRAGSASDEAEELRRLLRQRP